MSKVNILSKIHIITLIAFAGLMFALHPATAQDETSPPAVDTPTVLTLDQCLSIAEENNISLKRARLGLEFSLLDRIRNLAAFDPGFSLNFSVQGSDSSGTTSGSSVGNQYRLSSDYTLPTFMGGAWDFSLGQTRTEGTALSGDTLTDYTQHTSELGVSYSLPLLEGYGDRVNRIGIEKSDLGITRSEMAIRDASRSLRMGIIQAYIQAVLAQKTIEVNQVSLQTAENLVSETQARIDVGQLAPYELLAAQAGLAERQTALLNAQTNLSTALDTLKDIIGLAITDEIAIDPSVLQPIYLEVDPDQLFYQAQVNRPDLADIDLRIKQAQLDLLLAENRTDASLAWTSALGLSGRDTGYFQSIGDMNDFSWSTGLEYRIPLNGNRSAFADYDSALLSLTQLELERLDFMRTLQTNIRNAVDTLNNALMRIDVTSQGLHVQEVKMESERARLELGLITTRDLLNFDLDLANARLAYDSALADAITALARIENLVNGTLLQDAFMLGGISDDMSGSVTESTEAGE